MPARSRDLRPWLWLTLAMQAAGFAALAPRPEAAPLAWAMLLGAGLGGCFSLSMIVALDHLPDPAEAGTLSALMQGGGFLMTAPPPWLVAVLHEATGRLRRRLAAARGLCRRRRHPLLARQSRELCRGDGRAFAGPAVKAGNDRKRAGLTSFRVSGDRSFDRRREVAHGVEGGRSRPFPPGGDIVLFIDPGALYNSLDDAGRARISRR